MIPPHKSCSFHAIVVYVSCFFLMLFNTVFHGDPRDGANFSILVPSTYEKHKYSNHVDFYSPLALPSITMVARLVRWALPLSAKTLLIALSPTVALWKALGPAVKAVAVAKAAARLRNFIIQCLAAILWRRTLLHRKKIEPTRVQHDVAAVHVA